MQCNTHSSFLQVLSNWKSTSIHSYFKSFASLPLPFLAEGLFTQRYQNLFKLPQPLLLRLTIKFACLHFEISAQVQTFHVASSRNSKVRFIRNVNKVVKITGYRVIKWNCHALNFRADISFLFFAIYFPNDHDQKSKWKK